MDNYKVSLLSFQLKDSENKDISYINFDGNTEVSIKVSCLIYFSQQLKHQIIESNKNDAAFGGVIRTQKVYLIASFNNLYIARQIIRISSKDLEKSNFTKLEFKFTCPKRIDNFKNKKVLVTNVHLQMATTYKAPNEMGISESLRVGTFFETTVPVLGE